MIGAVAVELLVLRKRAATWVLLAIWTALAAFFAYVLPYVIAPDRAGAPSRPLGDLLPDRLVGTLSVGFPFFGGAIALILAVMTIGGDYSWGTWKTLLTQRPGRLRVFAAKLVALGTALIPFVLAVFLAGAVCSFLIARSEGEAVTWPSAALLLRGFLADWLILIVWAAFGVMLAVLTRGVAMAMGIGILYPLVIEGLLSAFAGQVNLLEPAVEFFLRANAYSLVRGVGASVQAAADTGPGAFSGPYVDSLQATLVLTAYAAGFLVVSAYLLRRRDVVERERGEPCVRLSTPPRRAAGRRLRRRRPARLRPQPPAVARSLPLSRLAERGVIVAGRLARHPPRKVPRPPSVGTCTAPATRPGRTPDERPAYGGAAAGTLNVSRRADAASVPAGTQQGPALAKPAAPDGPRVCIRTEQLFQC